MGLIMQNKCPNNPNEDWGSVVASRLKSALKKHRQSLKRRARNQNVRSSLRTLIKKLRAEIEGNDRESAIKTLRSVVRSLDKAATKGVIQRRKASRLASRLSKRVYQSFGQPPILQQ